VFAVVGFRALFAAHLTSIVGDQLARVALAILVYDRTRSASATALTYALTFLPSLAGGLLAGIADRHDRRAVMIGADLSRAALLVVMAVPGLPLPVVAGLLVVVQLLAGPAGAARAAILATLLEGDRYVLGSAISNTAYQLAQVIGIAGGGLAVLGIGSSAALLGDAATFLVSAALVARFVAAQPPAAPGPSAPSRRTHRGDLAAGARLVWQDPRLRWLVGAACLSACYISVEGLAVPYAAQIGAPGAAGWLLAATPAGVTVGMLLIGRVAADRRLVLLGPLPVLSCLPLIITLSRPSPAVAVLAWAGAGAAACYQLVANATFVRAVPDASRGQAFGLAVTALRVSQGIGVIAAGALADLLDPATAIALAGAAGAALATALWSRMPAWGA
jgi:hypothetical protein